MRKHVKEQRMHIEKLFIRGTQIGENVQICKTNRNIKREKNL